MSENNRSLEGYVLTTSDILKIAMNHDERLRNSNWTRSIDDVIEDLKTLRTYAELKPEEYKELKTIFLHESTMKAGIISEVYLRGGYFRESHTFNTILRCNNDLRIRSNQIKKIKANEIPPAFDDQLLSDKIDIDNILSLIKSRKIGKVNKIIDDIRKSFAEVPDEDGYDEILVNGSTTGIQDGSHDLCDINSICYAPPSWFLEEFAYLINELNINNFKHELLDCPIDPDARLGGEILHIPDKEFKIRSIYRMYWFVQLVSKRIGRKLETIAKRIEGNYTYDHRKWLYNLVDEGFNKSHYILTTDMTKYSDTLHRDFVFGVLEIAIDDKELVRQMKMLYTLPVRDSANGIVYSEPNGTYQGQYGDFSAITICNCILQRIVYYLSGQKLRKGFLAAVGDDTGFVFEEYDDKIMDTVIETYGNVGVRINRSKTHELIFGSGFGDFVKMEICSEGIIDFFNISNAYKNNIDGFIREIYDSYLIHKDEELLNSDFSTVFGSEIGKYFSDLSIINGGVSWRNINQDDLNLFYRRNILLKRLGPKFEDGLRTWFNDYKETLKDNNLSIKKTPLVGWFDHDQYTEWAKETGNISLDDFLESRMFNTLIIGYDPKLKGVNITDLLDVDMEKLKEDLDQGKEINEGTFRLIELIRSYESKEAQRRRKSRRNNISAYLTTLGMYTINDTIADFVVTGEYVKHPEDYHDKWNIKRRVNNQQYLHLMDGVFQAGPYWGNYYLRWRHGGKTYSVDKYVWDSKYPRPSEDLWCRVMGTDSEFYFDMFRNIE